MTDPPVDDTDLDPADPCWSGPGPYGAGDTLGTYREVTGARRAAAWSLLAGASSVQPVPLGEPLFVGYPGWGSRSYGQTLWVAGAGMPDPGGAEVAFDRPRGTNAMVSLEERVRTSYNLGTKVNGLAHAAVGPFAYGGRRVADLLAEDGTRELDTTTWGPPLLTRGLLFDVLALKLESGSTDVSTTTGGQPLLRGNYRVTDADLDACRRRQQLPEPRAGDALLLRTGWRRMLHDDATAYLTQSPGVWLRETRLLARTKPALVGTDSWCWGTIDPALARGRLGSCHQELIVGHGIRIAESLNLDGLADCGSDVFVFAHTPLEARGAVSSSAPPTAYVPGPADTA